MRILDREKHFWGKVKKTDGCWLWTGYMRGIKKNNKHVIPSRYAYMISKGPIPKGMMVLHTCDVRSCVRPDHLKLGNAAQNQADKFLKGRSCYGERNGRHKLTEEHVHQIDRLWRRGITHEMLARMFGVCRKTTERITRRASWTYLAVARY